MRILVVSLLYLSLNNVFSQSNDYTTLIENSQIIVSLSSSEDFVLEKEDVGVIKPKWISSISVWTDQSKKEELGYFGEKNLITLELKKRREDDFLEALKELKLD